MNPLKRLWEFLFGTTEKYLTYGMVLEVREGPGPEDDWTLRQVGGLLPGISGARIRIKAETVEL